MRSTLRVDLRHNGDVILILKGSVLQPFKITSHDTENRKVKGMWVLTDIEDSIKGGTPTIDLTEEWVDIYLRELAMESKRLKKRITILTEIKNDGHY